MIWISVNLKSNTDARNFSSYVGTIDRQAINNNVNAIPVNDI